VHCIRPYLRDQWPLCTAHREQCAHPIELHLAPAVRVEELADTCHLLGHHPRTAGTTQRRIGLAPRHLVLEQRGLYLHLNRIGVVHNVLGLVRAPEQIRLHGVVAEVGVGVLGGDVAVGGHGEFVLARSAVLKGDELLVVLEREGAQGLRLQCLVVHVVVDQLLLVRRVLARGIEDIGADQVLHLVVLGLLFGGAARREEEAAIDPRLFDLLAQFSRGLALKLFEGDALSDAADVTARSGQSDRAMCGCGLGYLPLLLVAVGTVIAVNHLLSLKGSPLRGYEPVSNGAVAASDQRAKMPARMCLTPHRIE
jgi:hypothetical protein